MQSFIDKSKPILQKAVALDRDNKKNEAVENYAEGITLLLSAMSCNETTENTREILREKISKYLARAEVLKGQTKPEILAVHQMHIMHNEKAVMRKKAIMLQISHQELAYVQALLLHLQLQSSFHYLLLLRVHQSDLPVAIIASGLTALRAQALLLGQDNPINTSASFIASSRERSLVSIGFGYERIFKRCADNDLTEITVRDAYIILPYQVLNFVRFCELFVLHAPNLKTIRLWTHYDSKAEGLLQQLKASLACHNIELSVYYDENFHDREIRFSNGWMIKIGRGLNYFQNVGYYEIGCMLHYVTRKKQKSAAVCGVSLNVSIQSLDAYKTNLMKQAEKIVLEEFPKKVLEFNNLLEDEQFSYERLPELLPNIDLGIPYAEQLIEYAVVLEFNDRNSVEHENDDGVFKKKRKIDHANIQPLHGYRTSVYGFINGTVKCNEKLASLTDITRPLLRDSVEAVNKVKMWILFLIPRIEDGNNFRVSIQEEALSEVRTVEGEAASFLDQMSRYFVSRARLVTKVAKYPHVEDYRRAILDMDEKQFINIRLVLTEMRNHFATLHDMITKNLEKIKTPRSNNTEHMY
ncbi:Proteasome activator complex subunit 3 [Dirofilaria immitis]|nr:Proteasome activator complex subunit 3 [Dirofilaria immitis]